MATCVTWKQPDANHFNGFCTNKFRLTTPPYDVRVDNGCDLCVKPTNALYNNTCLCPDGFVDGPRLYNLQVDEINGPWYGVSRPYADTYGSFTLTNRGPNGTYSCGASCEIVVQQPNSLFYSRGVWVLDPGAISVISGRLYRSHMLSLRMYRGSSIVTTYSWVVPVYFPACDNRDRLPTTVPFHLNSVQENTPSANPFFPDVQANHYSITIS